TTRVALSNDRILDIQDGKITFSRKDYKDHSRPKAMTLEANPSYAVTARSGLF
ncbi:MAG: transposase, partial [Candidatus Binatia bacterium]